MTKNREGLLRELIRLKEILERMPNAFHSISLNPSSGDNYVSPAEWVRWAKFSAPLSKRCPATSGLQFPPYLVMDAFLGRKKYDSFLGAEGVHLRAWLPSNWRAFIAAIEYHYSIPDYVAQSGDSQLIGALDGIVEAYAGERGFMGTHRYKVFGLLEVAGKTGRTETNGQSGAPDANGRPWEETHKAFSEAMKERLEPYRGNLHVEPHHMRGTFAECRYTSRVLGRYFVDSDPERSIAKVMLDIQETGITFQPGDRLAVMTLNSWTECAKVAAALGFEQMLDHSVVLDSTWQRFAEHLGSVSKIPVPRLTVKDILRRGHLAPLTKELVMKLHTMLRASSNTVLQVLATTEWPVRASLGDLLQAAVAETPAHIWDQAFDLSGSLLWLSELVQIEVPRTYSISNYPDELLPSTVDLTVSRSDYNVSSIFSQSDPLRHGVGSSFLNPPVAVPEEFIADDEELLIGVSRPFAFQLPIDDAAPCAFFAGGSGIAPFRSFWQCRAGRSIGRNILFLGVQSREKFCYESELREYVNSGSMEVYTAFSRDTRGLMYDRNARDLVETETPPRYIDAAIIEQGAMVCDLVLSKKLGGFGGYLYVCGSLSVFDSVISGIRRAIYNHRTTRMESTDVILDTAFAERRFMLDVFMSPKPLPCNIPTIPMSQLAMHTGHVSGTPIWIAVHGSVYDVTEFCKMHPGGTSIIKSNAGVDCSKSFDLLAHTNNPEVSSLLNKYFIGHLTPKSDYHQCQEITVLHDLWAEYLKTSVETLVSQAFEVHEFMESSHLWFQGDLFNMGGVRRFYHHQSRLLQGGFSALFGAKLQELYLKLSFTLANAATGSNPSRMPDILGIVARAKGSQDAMATSKIVSEIGRFTSDSEAARFHERGILEYARTSVKLDMELLEGIREDACVGMDAFDNIMELDAASESQRITALSTFLLQVMERMAVRLDGFYSKLAQHSIYNPEMEQNPARTRWNLIRRKIHDGSFFVLTQDILFGIYPPQTSPRNNHGSIELDQIITQIQQSISKSPVPRQLPLDLTEQHVARGQAASNGMSAYESHESSNAVRRMSKFMTDNMRSIRRLSKMPPSGSISLEHLMAAYGPRPVPQYSPMPQYSQKVPTPPSSRGPSRSSSTTREHTNLQLGGLNMRGRIDTPLPTPNQSQTHRSRVSSVSSQDNFPVAPAPQTLTRITSLPVSSTSPLPAMFSKMNRRATAQMDGKGAMRASVSARSSVAGGAGASASTSAAGRAENSHSRVRSNTSLRAFKLQDLNVRVAPTF
jgi:sulfite reductase alpha subunit-like flavoprotein/predicted heme/steroid binding protein